MKIHDKCRTFKRFVGIFLLCISLLLVTGCTGLNRCTAPAFDTSMEKRIQAALDDAVVKYKVPGAVLAIGDPGGIVHTWATGFADIEKKTPMTADLYVRIGSMTKSYTATVVLQLVDEGALDLDKPVSTYLPGLIDCGNRITIRHLLEMRSGLGNYSFNDKFQKAAGADPRKVWQPAELIGYSNFTVAVPGTVFEYNNANYILLGMIIEKVTGSTYREAVSRRILQPLGMRRTFVPATIAMPDPYAHGYLYADGAVMDGTFSIDPSAAWSAGNILSTATDQILWVNALVEGRLISPALHGEQFDMKPCVIRAGSYGFGVMNVGGMVGHGGNYNNAFTSVGARYHGYDIAIMVNGQADGADPKKSNARTILIEVFEKAGL